MAAPLPPTAHDTADDGIPARWLQRDRLRRQRRHRARAFAERLAELDPAVMARQFAVNATGPALLLKHFADLLSRRGRGWIAYRSAKAALNQVVRTAAIELRWRRPGAVCVALHPGTVATALSAPFRRDDDGALQPDEAVRRLLAVLDRLDSGVSGGLYDHAGTRIPG